MTQLKSAQIYLAALILINVILSGYVMHGNLSGTEFCVAGGDCHSVQNSEYGTFLGMKVSVFGTISLTILFALYILSIKTRKFKKLYLTAAILGGLGAIYFIYIQKFVLKQFCSSCLVIDSIMIIIAIMSIHEYKKSKRSY